MHISTVHSQHIAPILGPVRHGKVLRLGLTQLPKSVATVLVFRLKRL